MKEKLKTEKLLKKTSEWIPKLPNGFRNFRISEWIPKLPNFRTDSEMFFSHYLIHYSIRFSSKAASKMKKSLENKSISIGKSLAISLGGAERSMSLREITTACQEASAMAERQLIGAPDYVETDSGSDDSDSGDDLQVGQQIVEDAIYAIALQDAERRRSVRIASRQ